MESVLPCTGCGGRSVLLQYDGVYYFVSCEQCQKATLRGGSPQEALDMWNNDSSTMFTFGEDLRRSRILKRLECNGRRDERIVLELPVVISVGGPRGRRVTGNMRNVSHYGAFLELTGGDMSAIPVDMGEFSEQESYVFFKLPKALKDEGPMGVQMLRFSPRHMYQRREVLGVGGCFVQLKREQMDMLVTLVRHAQDHLTERNSTATTKAS